MNHGIGSDILIIILDFSLIAKLLLTSVIAKQVVVFLRETRPRRALFLTMQYGTPIFLQRAGRKRTSWNEKNDKVINSLMFSKGTPMFE